VLDIGPGIDGILGMNLFNTADSIVYNPYGPGGASLSMTFLTDRDTTGASELDALLADLNSQLNSIDSGFAFSVRGQGQILPHLNLVPEPSTAALATFGLAGLFGWRRRNKQAA
jgi:hypothetical protein